MYTSQKMQVKDPRSQGQSLGVARDETELRERNTPHMKQMEDWLFGKSLK